VCGADNDANLGCRECVQLRWWQHLSTKKNPLSLSQSKIVETLREHTNKRMPQNIELKSRKPIQLSPEDIRKHLEGRHQLLTRFHDCLKATTSSEQSNDKALSLVLPPPNIGETGDELSYDLVFRSATSRTTISNPFFLFNDATPTEYGVGASCMVFSEENLRKYARAGGKKGCEVEVLIGIAFRFRTLEDALPFRPTTNNSSHNNNNKKNANHAKKNANKMQEQFIRKGYDCVGTTTNRVYWHCGVILPVERATFVDKA